MGNLEVTKDIKITLSIPKTISITVKVIRENHEDALLKSSNISILLRVQR
jgi:hypothetical protein